jgi:ABC-2 type transport system ATP-binding protein
MPSSPAVQARQVSKIFDGGVGVHDLDLDVPAGTIFGFIGPSGSGKTTTVRLFTGVLARDTGELKVLGEDPSNFGRSTRGRLGYMPQLSVLYPNLTIWENLNFCASIYGMSWRRKKHLTEALEFVELDDARSRLLRDASGGMQRRLALAATLVHDPDLLFLDEPTGGIDPMLRRKFWDHFTGLREQGRTLFVTTQYVGEAAYCDHVGVLADGRLLMVDTPDGLRRAALGGDVVDITLKLPPGAEDVEALARLSTDGQVERQGPTKFRLVVEEASTALPGLSELCAARNLEVEAAEEYVPSFDDVFVELVSREQQSA